MAVDIPVTIDPLAASRLDAAVSAVCPIKGVSIGDWADSSTWKARFLPTATESQIAAAQAVIANFDPKKTASIAAKTPQLSSSASPGLPLVQGVWSSVTSIPQQVTTITRTLCGRFVVIGNGKDQNTANSINDLGLGNSKILYNDGKDEITLSVSKSGEVTLKKTSGSAAFKVLLDLLCY
jgi:hypothetical protein